MWHQIIILGFAGGDAELRYTPNGKEVANFSLATSRRYTDGTGNQQTETTWFRVTCWEKQAIIASERVRKGSPVFVVGRLLPDRATGGPRIYTRQQDGTPAANYEVQAVDLRIVEPRSQPREPEFLDEDAQHLSTPAPF